MPLYELTGARGPIYWEISVAGRVVTTRTSRAADMRYQRSDSISSPGRRYLAWVDTLGAPTTTEHPDAARARAAFERAIATKKRAGYRLIHGVEESPDETQARRDERLEETLVGAPDDESAIAVYGDWLQSVGDARGEIIMLQCEMLRTSDRVRFMTLKKSEQALLARHQAAWLGEPVVENATKIKLVWQRGFVHTAKLSALPETMEEILRALIAAPAGLLLRRIDIETSNAQTGVRDALVAARPRCLTTLTLWGGLPEADQELLRAAIPTLREIR